MRDLFRRNGRAAVCFACVAPFVQGGTWAHWVGIERHEGKVRVMDPLYASGYCPLAKWKRERKGQIDCIIAAYGFVKRID